ncbi:preprotein translocase subunit SecG [Sandaracinobacteroides saxicola]|uniref:Protein-export membrane protein SecG n=1 Tax=Sandaracinobacteroides saxicola TaxID=2759707 RepID=A0A7G5IMF3_9SPHN|nr:preprotein translocase subunit SecG [Sandaracinobacteroides saxicola]QMW24545.1 preprotein translocase subunit SecG [Sandaracinobacteroides saxicola]
MMTFLLVVHTLLALALVGVILIQKSEGGGLGIGGGSTGGLVSARGAADLLTRSTTALATLFIVTSLLLAFLAAGQGKKATTIDTSLARQTAPASPIGPLPGAPAVPATPAPAAPAPADSVPLQK